MTDADQLLARGQAALEAGEFQNAVANFNELVRIAPRAIVAWCGRSAAFFGAGDLANARVAAKRARELAPNDARVYHVLGPPAFALGDAALQNDCRRFLELLDKEAARALALFWVQRLSESECYTEAAAAFGVFRDGRPDDVADALQQVQLLLNASDPAAAEEILIRLVERGADSGRIDALLARSKLMCGDLDSATNFARRAIEADRNCIAAYMVLADTNPAAIDEEKTAHLRKLLAGRDLAVGQRVVASAALGKALEKRGDFDGAFAAFSDAKAEAKRTLVGSRYDPASAEAMARRVIEWFPSFAPAEPRDAHLVFIIGMPRSGSTLIDQILSRHQYVASVGESLIMPRLHEKIARSVPESGRRFRDCIGEHRTEFDESYRATGHGARRVVDKNLSNYWRCGLIADLDPGARFILTLRDPIDVGLSVFRTNFMAAHPWSTDLDDIAHTIACFEFLTEHWRRALGERMVVVRHEGLVADFEPTVRLLLDFCGLEFDPACLDFHDAARPVFTQSAAQVRRPLNAEGLERWRAYERQLGGFRESLARHRARLGLATEP